MFGKSRWFTRGWTLPELLAPRVVEFYSLDYIRLGKKHSLEKQISERTGIPTNALQGMALARFSVEERFSWVKERQTTEVEDKAYCLLGIFGIFLPLIYEEGQASAMRRLRKEVQENGDLEYGVRSQCKAHIQHLMDFANSSFSKNIGK